MSNLTDPFLESISAKTGCNCDFSNACCNKVPTHHLTQQSVPARDCPSWLPQGVVAVVAAAGLPWETGCCPRWNPASQRVVSWVWRKRQRVLKHPNTKVGTSEDTEKQMLNKVNFLFTHRYFCSFLRCKFTWTTFPLPQLPKTRLTPTPIFVAPGLISHHNMLSAHKTLLDKTYLRQLERFESIRDVWCRCSFVTVNIWKNALNMRNDKTQKTWKWRKKYTIYTPKLHFFQILAIEHKALFVWSSKNPTVFKKTHLQVSPFHSHNHPICQVTQDLAVALVFRFRPWPCRDRRATSLGEVGIVVSHEDVQPPCPKLAAMGQQAAVAQHLQGEVHDSSWAF